MKILMKTNKMSKDEWLKWRTKGIGGSDVSIIAGINKFKSVFQLWLEKTGQVVPREEYNDYTHFGNILESVVKNEFMERTGLKVRAKKAILQSEEYPFMLADLDGIIYENGEKYIFEAKTASAYKQDVWENGVPEEYQLQVQHYMAVTGIQKTYIAALVGGNHFYYHEVLRNEEIIQNIIQMEKSFWEENVLQGIEPVADGTEATTDFLNEKYRESNGNLIILPEDAADLCKKYDELTEQLNSLKEKKDAISNQLKNYLKENEVGIVGDRRVTWKEVMTTNFDKKRLERENRALYEAYVSKKRSRRLLIA